MVISVNTSLFEFYAMWVTGAVTTEPVDGADRSVETVNFFAN